MDAPTKTPPLLDGWYSMRELSELQSRYTEYHVDDIRIRLLCDEAMKRIYFSDGIAARIVDGRVTAIRICEEEM